MKQKSPISMEEILFRSYNFNEKSEIEAESNLGFDDFIFDLRRDFLIDKDFAGIAVRLGFMNQRYLVTGKERGVRRKVSVTLIDATKRVVISTKEIRVAIKGEDPYATFYVDFPAESSAFASGHTYKVVVRDEGVSEVITEEVIHLFGTENLGNPANWYEIENACVIPEGETEPYRYIKLKNYDDYRIKFYMTSRISHLLPMILPELEVRIYFPEEVKIISRFVEPRKINSSDPDYYVEVPSYVLGTYSGTYYAELLCMEYPVAGFVFSVEGPVRKGMFKDEDLKPLEEYSKEGADNRLAMELKNHDILTGNATIKCDEKSLLQSLDNLTGLSSVKEKLITYERIVRFNKLRADNGLPVCAMPLHSMFLGSPGTGKTTVAKLMGEMLKEAGMLSKGHVVVRERATLLGQNYSAESEKTLAAIEEAQGGILLIDEAYQLYQPNDARDPGKFVIETLLTSLADESQRDWMLILAGYPDGMKRMFDMNPGFRSRIPDSNIYNFEDFTEEELMEIAERYFATRSYNLTADARAELKKRLASDYSMRDRSFGNARHVVNMIQTEILPAMAVRVIKSGKKDIPDLSEILKEDIPQPVKKKIRPGFRIGFAS